MTARLRVRVLPGLPFKVSQDMTNNRLWLVHRPSGKVALLAKKGAELWSAFHTDNPEELNNLFDRIWNDPTYCGDDQDEFILLRDDQWDAYEGPLDPYPRSQPD